MEFFKHIKPLATETDWPIWKRKVRDLLDYHEGAIEVIDGKLVKPEPIDETASELAIREHRNKLNLYRKANSYAKSMIASSVTDIVYQKIMDQESAFDAWNALKQHFEASSRDQLFKICSDFFSFNWNNSEDVSMHIAKLKSLWNELNNGLKAKQENELPELLIVCKTLNILPESYNNFKSSWMLLKGEENKTFDDLTVQLCSYERNFTRQEKGSSVSQEAFAAELQKKTKKKLQNSTCNYCKKPGHWVRQCKKWKEDGKPRKSQEASEAEGLSLMIVEEQSMSVETINDTTWWIDNGATKHVTNNMKYFVDFEEFKAPSGIRSAGIEILSAIGKGTINIKTVPSGKVIQLKDVWYVPKLSRNLFSVLAAQERNPKSIFQSTATKCKLSNQGKLMLQGSRKTGGTLFEANIIPLPPVKSAEANVADELQLYHERWGHQDKRHVAAKMQKELNIKVGRIERQPCEPCIYGKTHRLPFGHRVRASKPGELMSADVCGPFPPSYAGKRYVVVFKDSYTKFRYGYLLSEKSEVKNKLVSVLKHARQLGHPIREIISDNGGEMDNRAIRDILSSEGVTQRLTAPYTPQQNGICERDFRTTIEMARTFRYSNKEIVFPEEMWAEFVATSIYILNRTGKSSEEDKSPYQLWIGKKPRIRHLRVIGSTCYVHIPDQRRKKLDKKATKGYLIGYDGDERYRIWIKEEDKVVVSRDVFFQEKPCECELSKLPVQVINQGKQSDEECSEEIEENGSVKPEEDIESEAEEQDNTLSQFTRELRDRSKLNKPAKFNDYVSLAEELVFQVETPTSFHEAMNSEKSSDWKNAMEEEIKSLKENNTWELTSLPNGCKAIPCKWVYKVKTNPDGSIDKYKARLVAKGYSQRYGIDFTETFSPVAKLSTVRAMVGYAAKENLRLMQFDVTTAFLYGELDTTIYMEQPEAYSDGTKNVCKLLRSLYGLKQAPRCWNKRFSSWLKGIGFKMSEADPCLHIRGTNENKILIACFVDDGLVMAKDPKEAEGFISELMKEFKITVKPASYYLGFQIEHRQDGSIKLSQESYARKLLERFNFSECRPVSTPMVKGDVLENEENVTQFPYREAVGALMYLMIGTRPDLAYSVSVLSRTLDSPSAQDVMKLKRVLRYVKGTVNMGIVFSANRDSYLKCYSDADFGGCKKTGRSTSGVVVTFAGGAVSWLSKRQQLTATSTTEAELVAANEAVKEIIWLMRLFENMGCPKQVPVLQIDNQSTIRLCHNPENHHRTKHISIKYFFIREKVLDGVVKVEYVSTEDQLADIMTKVLPKTRLINLSSNLGLSLL